MSIIYIDKEAFEFLSLNCVSTSDLFNRVHTSVEIKFDINKNPSYKKTFTLTPFEYKKMDMMSVKYNLFGCFITKMDIDPLSGILEISFSCDYFTETPLDIARSMIIDEVLKPKPNNKI